MQQADRVTEQFEASRGRLRAIAYRMLGSRADADDAVQETWLRLARTDSTAVDNLGGWLTTVLARVCLDRLRSRRSRPDRATDVSSRDWDVIAATDSDPEDEAVMAESVGAALLVVLDLLNPSERVAFVLHDVFAVPFDEVAEIVGRSPDAARQLASRARRRVQGTATTVDIDLVRHREVVTAFYRAARDGDFDGLMALLDPDVELRPDAAAQRLGALGPMRGAEAIVASMTGGARAARPALVDGVTGLAWMPGGQIRGAVEFTILDGRIVAIDAIGDPERLQTIDIVLLDV